jgi:O-antigen ligase
MLSSSANKINVYVALFLGIFIGFAYIKLLPFANINLIFLFVLPMACILILGIVLDLKLMIALLLFSRALLDPVLNMTKIDALGLGMGALLNLFVLMLTLMLALKNFKYFTGTPAFKPWVIFLLLSAVTISYSPVPIRSLKLLINLSSYLCMMALPSLIQPERNDKRFWIKVLLASTVLPVIFANLDMVKGGTSFEDAGSRILGTFTHPNILAFYLVLVVGLVFYTLKTMPISRVKKAFLLMYLANVFILLIATKTRNAWISCWLLFLIYGFLKQKRYIFISLGIVAVAMLIPEIASRAADMKSASSGGKLNSFAWRVELWKSSMPWIKERFFTGYGLASFQDMSRQFFLLERKGVDAHNTYVQILFEMGIFGLLSYITIYFSIFKTFLARIKRSPGKMSMEYAIILSYIITYVISCYADNMFFYLAMNWYFWFLIGVMLKAAKFASQHEAYLAQNFRRNPLV